MRLLVSGEGPSDIGTTAPGAAGPEFVPGAMMILLDQLAQQHVQFSLIDYGLVDFISETDLTKATKSGAQSPHFPGKRSGKETGQYFKRARQLALLAQKKGLAVDDVVIPVLFQDTDGTHSTRRGLWQAKWDSMLNGFAAAGSPLGVPMLPKPKSEAWLLCACKPQPYQHCAQLEDESGNDRSQNPLKDQLEVALDGNSATADLVDAIQSGRIDPLQIDMPSYNQFRTRLDEVMQQALRG